MFCTSCNQDKESAAFRPMNKSTCRACLNERQRGYAKQEWFKASTAASKAAHAKEVRAQGVVRSAVYRGTLKKTPCMVCGVEKVEAHHADYDRPRDVIWLCRSHHVAAHAAIGA